MFTHALFDYMYFYPLTLLFWAAVFGVTWFVKKQTAGKYLSFYFLLAVSFSFLGLTIGIMVGLSESPVIGVVLPALLTFIGGFIIYAFVFSDNSKLGNGYVLMLILISLSFFLMLGSGYSSISRSIFDSHEKEYEFQQKLYFEFYQDSLKKAQSLNQAVSAPDTQAQSIVKMVLSKPMK